MTDMIMENNTKPCCRKSHVVIKVIGMILLTAIVGLAILRDRFVTNPQWQVSVIGRGQISYMPDMAKINIGVHVDRASTAEAALKQLNDNMAKVVAAITAVGIDKKDIQTQNYNLSPQYDYVNMPPDPLTGAVVSGKRILAGYTADQQLLVTIKDLSEEKGLVGKVISSANQAGSNTINSISFDTSDLNNLKEQARLAAIKDAKSKAGELAAAAGVKLGKTIGWWENFVQGPDSYPAYDYGKGGAMGVSAPQPTIPTGAYDIILEINLNYEVK